MAVQEHEQDSLQSNKALVRRWFEQVINQGDMQLFDEICAVCHPNFVMIKGAGAGDLPGKEGAKKQIELFRSAMPDLTFTVEEQIAEGNKVVSRISAHGTHQGELFGIPPTGKKVKFKAVSIWTVGNGQLVQEEIFQDMLGVLQQLGVAPAAPGQAQA
jgi:steroid delta-isomerase-like uncharacterized protein